jgi:arginine exporter protein ArgO
VHALYAVAGLVAASSWAASKNYFIWGGAVYLVVWIYGLVIDESGSANILGVNNAADWLHFVLGITMIAIGYLLSRRVVADRTAAV